MIKHSSIYDNLSRVVIDAKCKITSITLCGDGDVGGLTVYDGLSDKMGIKTRILVASGDSKSFTFGKGLILLRGVYVAVENANSKYTISYELIDEKEVIE